MIVFTKDSVAYKLFKILISGGVFYLEDFPLLGKEEEYMPVILEMLQATVFYNPETNEKVFCKALSMSGKENSKKIALLQNASIIVKWTGNTDGYTYLRTRLSAGCHGDIDRIRKIGQTLAVMQNANVEILQSDIPKISINGTRHHFENGPSFYESKTIKILLDKEQNKNVYSRMIGLLMYPQQSYAVYNTMDVPFEWHGSGEHKARLIMQMCSRLNGGSQNLSEAILIGKTYDTALKTLKNTEKWRNNIEKAVHNNNYSLDAIYEKMFFIELNINGEKFIRIMTVPGWLATLRHLVFSDEEIEKGKQISGYDAISDGFYTLLFMDNDIAKLERFACSRVFSGEREKCQVYCFEEQEKFIKQYLGNIFIKTAPFSEIYSCFFSETEE